MWHPSIFGAIFCAFLASTSGLLQSRIKRQSGVLETSSGIAAGVGKADLEALKVEVVKKFLLAVLFSAHNDEKRTNETKVRPLRRFFHRITPLSPPVFLRGTSTELFAEVLTRESKDPTADSLFISPFYRTLLLSYLISMACDRYG